jgi:hypothetical protein
LPSVLTTTPLIDSDSHVTEPADLWTTHLPAHAVSLSHGPVSSADRSSRKMMEAALRGQPDEIIEMVFWRNAGRLDEIEKAA